MLKNKKILIAGLANKHSIAAGIAQAMHAQGAELAFTYQSERLKGNVEKIASELGSNLLFECDVASDESIANMYQELSKNGSLLMDLFTPSVLHQLMNWKVTLLMLQLERVFR